jgi:GT2 family glycosyltransferase
VRADRRADPPGAVAIGRNEGERLSRCLASLSGRASPIVYVDSGSTDGSVERARSLGADVVDLDLSVPFTAARARNAGWRRLAEIDPKKDLVQFVDGDCEVVPDWIDAAARRLDERPELGVVCGRRRERDPGASVYNRLCDIEWDTPIGDTDACGGDAMMRISALVEVGGFDATVIAGEEPELCVRLRRRGYKIERLDREMTLHDAAMTSWSQWWRRAERAGHSFAEGAHRHGASAERHWVAESRRILFWGLVVPAVAIGGAVPTLGLSLGLFAAYPVSALRAYRSAKARGRTGADAALYGVSCTLGKFPEAVGALRFHANRARGRASPIIEYKR